jgi:hypothetical protein
MTEQELNELLQRCGKAEHEKLADGCGLILVVAIAATVIGAIIVLIAVSNK